MERHIKDEKLKLALLLEIVSSLKDLTEEEVLCERLLERLSYHFQIRRGAIYLKNHDNDSLHFVSGIGVDRDSIGTTEISPQHSGLFAIFNLQAPIRIDFITPADRAEFPFLVGATSALVLPMHSENRPLGFAFFAKTGDNELFSETEESLLKIMLQLISPIVDLQMTFRELHISKSKLMEAYENLKSFDSIRNSFLLNISHELKTPLVTIVGYSEILHSRDVGEMNQVQMKAVETIMKNSQGLLTRIEDLLTFVNLSSKLTNLEEKKVDVIELSKKVIARFEQSPAQIIFMPSDKHLFVKGDEYLLQKALENLVSNALKFNRDNNPITVAVASEKNERGERQISVTVIDQGIGFERNSVESISEAFVQESREMERRFGGLGFGLALTIKIVKAHHFDMLFSTEKGRGSTIGFKAAEFSNG